MSHTAIHRPTAFGEIFRTARPLSLALGAAVVLFGGPTAIWGEPTASAGYGPNPYETRHFSSVDARGPQGDKAVAFANEECCNDPGEIAGCWWQDAERDGVVCLQNGDCDSNTCDLSIRVDGSLPPNGWGLCECSDNSDCNSGICRDGLCGPSFCNGYLVCECWGGCDEADAWGHGTPYEACSDTGLGFPGFCCEGGYSRDVEGTGSGYCSDACPEDVECEVDEECDVEVADPLSEDCTEIVCVGGSCQVDFANEGSVCAQNAQVPDPLPAWHTDCRQYACTDAGVCAMEKLPAGTSCDDGDDCSASSACDADGACDAVSPDPTLSECCDPDDGTTFDDGNPCTSDTCSDATAATPFRDQHANLADGSSCDNGIDRIDDDCGVYVCSGGACVENTGSFVGLDCNLSAWSDCLGYVCSDQAGEAGVCVSVDRNEGVECAWINQPDTCDRKVCQAGACDYELSVGTTGCTLGSGTAAPCCEYACSADHECTLTSCNEVAVALETCEGSDMGSLGTPIGTALSIDGNSLCADDDYDVLTTNLFAACDVADDGETVYRFEEQTHLTEFQLRHTDITLTDDGAWDPVLYAATSCDTGGTIQADQYTCAVGGSPTITSGPWPLVDTPTSDNADGYTTENSRTTSVFVDSRNTATPSGGDYTLSVTVADHDNSSCVNTADTVEAPHLTGGSDWKVRFRGNTDGYSNYFYDLSQSLEDYTDQCGDGDAPDSNDPKFAFFRLDLPSGSETLSSGTMTWDHTYKLYTDPAGTGGLDDVLSLWGNNTPDGNCAGALADMQTCENPYETPPLTSPREIVVESGRSGFVAVSNQVSDESGNYELNLLRVPRPFLGVSQQFIGKGEGAAGSGCGCGLPDDANWEQGFQLGGYRLDFIPTNDDVGGYAVRKTAVDLSTPGAWLVSGGDEVCSGLDCTNPSGWASDSDGTAFDMQFQFPYSGDLWPYFCIDAAGRILLASSSSDCVNEWNYKPNTNDFLTGYDPPDGDTSAPPPVTPVIAPLWGSLVPCNRFYKTGSTTKNLQIESMSVFLQWLNSWTGWFDSWQWMNNRCASPGQVRRMRTVFEGTSAQVITWEGFGGFYYANNLSNGDPGPDHAMSFQVILRVDGRITFFYKMPSSGNTDWNFHLDTNGWIIGLSGGRSIACEDDDDCNDAFATSGLSCDVDDFTSRDGSGDDNYLWEAKHKCMNPVPLQSSGAIPVPGEWQGE